MEIIYAKDFGVLPSAAPEMMLHLRNLLDFAKKTGSVDIEFETGTYHFYPDFAKEIMLCISNHDEDTIKRVAFDCTGFHDVTIHGNGSAFIFHTDILPVYLHNCKNVSLFGFSVDYARPSYSEGTIMKAEPQKVIFSVDKQQYPYMIKHHRLYFIGENFEHEIAMWLEMDQIRYAPAVGKVDVGFNHLHYGCSASFKERKEGIIEAEITDDAELFPPDMEAGNLLIIRHHPRSHPAFYVTDSEDIVCSDISIYHACGMGFIAQFTNNITLQNFNVTFHPARKRVFTAAADATHFVYCKGLIHIRDCLFENQLDDPVNIHGIYGRIKTVLSETGIIAELVHKQQKGVRLGLKGDQLGLLTPDTMKTYAVAEIDSIEMLNRDYCRITLCRPVQGMKLGDAVENLAYVPDVLIEDCTFRNNRARGLLLTSAGKVEVRNNIFRTPGAAVLIEADASNWFESGAAKDIIITENVFENCAYVKQWGKAPIQVSPQTAKVEEDFYFHKKLVITNNTFTCFDERLIYAANIEEIVFTGNRVLHSHAFPAIAGERIVLEHTGKWNEKKNDM